LSHCITFSSSLP